MSFRPILLTASTLATALGGCLALCRWGAGGNRDLAALARAVRRADDLEGHLEGVRRRHQAEWDLAAKVIAGRMTLPEATGHFRRLDEANPVYPPGTPRPPGDEAADCD
jgi:hypothetical protein